MKVMPALRTLIPFWSMAFTCSAADVLCKPTDIEIRIAGWTKRADDDALMVMGALVNHCTARVAVQLQVVVKERDGRTIAGMPRWVSNLAGLNTGWEAKSVGSSPTDHFAFMLMGPRAEEGNSPEVKVVAITQSEDGVQ